MTKTDLTGIKPSDKVYAKGVLAGIKIVVKSLKPEDSKQLDADAYLNEVYRKLVNTNFDGASIMSSQKNWVRSKMKVKQEGLFLYS